MSLAGRSVVSIDDLSNEEIEAIFSLADAIGECPRKFWGRATARILATLFYEPSTRTRLSFEAAMQRLGGGTITQSDMSGSSASKGETLADTVRVVGKYADAIVLRHPWEGAANLAAQYAGVPVVNAGDGAHEHPTQTLCDLYTLRKAHGTLRGLKVALCGDLKNGRTIHSLAFALARFGAGVLFVPSEGKEVPEYVLHRLVRDHGIALQRMRRGILAALFGIGPEPDGDAPEVNAIYMTPSGAHQLTLMQQEGTSMEFKVTGKDSFALYVTRFQKERETQAPTTQGPRQYPVVTRDVLKHRGFGKVSILHPLPRVDELSPEIDQDKRSLYFSQAGYGIPIRMAILHLILGLGEEEPTERQQGYLRPARHDTYSRSEGLKCRNERCITVKEPQYGHPRFEVLLGDHPVLRCLYCDQEATPSFYGNIAKKRYYAASSLVHNRADLANVVFFGDAHEAADCGYKPAVKAGGAIATRVPTPGRTR